MKLPPVFCVLTLLLFGCSSANESANKLFVEATVLLQESFNQEDGDPKAALVASVKALDKLERITTSYPSSDLAVRLVQGQTIFNNLVLKELYGRQKKLQEVVRLIHGELSSETKHVLQALKSPVEVFVFLRPSTQQQQGVEIYEYVRNLFKAFEYFGRKNLRIEYVDTQSNPKRAQQLGAKYNVESPDVIIFAVGDHQKYLTVDKLVEMDFSQTGRCYRIKTFKGEGAILSAIQNVTQVKQPVIYFLTGHGERNPNSIDERDGYSRLSQYIKRDNLKIEPWNLAEKQALPEDAGMVVIAGPAKKFTALELSQLDEYLQKKGGRVLVMLDPHRESGLEAFLTRWGVQVDNNLAMAKGGTVLGTELLIVNALGSEYASHAITRKLEGINTEFPNARTVRRGKSEPSGGAAPLVTELVKTPAAYWGETDLDSKRSKFDEGQDMQGPLTLAVAVEANKPTGVELEVGQYRLVVVGTSGFVDNGGITEGNLDFFFNSLNWLLQRD